MFFMASTDLFFYTMKPFRTRLLNDPLSFIQFKDRAGVNVTLLFG